MSRCPLRRLFVIARVVFFLGLISTEVCSGQLSPTEIYRKVRPSAVLIYAENEGGKDAVQGSGFIVGPGRIVTNYHVLAGTSKGYVIFSDGTSALISGVIAESQSKDLLVLAANTGSRPALTLGDEMALHEGDPVVALGSPEGLQFTITDGIVSGFRNLEQQFVIQTTAAIAHGSSGGPLLNRQGQVVGITSSMLSDAPGIYFSIGVGDLKRLLRTPQLIITPLSQWATAKADVQYQAPNIKAVQTLIDQKKYADARVELQALLAKNDNDDTLHVLMGRVADGLGDLPTAVAEFAKASSIDPKNAGTHARYAIALMETKNFPEALVEIRAAKQIYAETPDSLVALMLYANAKYSDAVNAAKIGISKDPNDEISLEVITATEYHDKPEGDLWRQDAARLAIIDKSAAWAQIAQGFDEFKANHRDSGIAAFEAAKKDEFPDPLPYVILANIYLHDGNRSQGELEITAGLTAMPGNPELLQEGVFSALLNVQRDRAEQRMSELRSKWYDSPAEAAASCLYFYGTDQSSKAVAACERNLFKTPDNPNAHSNYGWAALDANQFNVALDQFYQAVRQYKEKKLTALQEIDLGWGIVLARYYSGDKKGSSELLNLLRKDYPAAGTLQGIKQLPLVWSDASLLRIKQLLQENP